MDSLFRISPDHSFSPIDFLKNLGDISTILDVSKKDSKNFGLNKPKKSIWENEISKNFKIDFLVYLNQNVLIFFFLRHQVL